MRHSRQIHINYLGFASGNQVASRSLHPNLLRQFHTTRTVRINPLLPIDGILEELQVEDSSKKIEKLEKKIRSVNSNKEKPKILIPANADDFKTIDSRKDGVHKVNDSSGNNNSKSPQSNDNGNISNNESKHKEHVYSEEPDPTKNSIFTKIKNLIIKCIETSTITFITLLVLGLAGLSYHRLYSYHVIDKMSQSFDVKPANSTARDEILSLQDQQTPSWIIRPQQRILDDIVSGRLKGRYFLLSGEKGSGKNSMVLHSIGKVQGLNCAYIDSHSDIEIFRIRLGKALNYEFNEDYFGALFSMRGPREGSSALLDIERAFDKLEEVALRRTQRNGGNPLVLVMNNVHLIKDDEGNNGEGSKLVELLQQKAEALSGAGLVTMVFIADDYWFYERLKKLSTRLEVLNFRDFTREESLKALEISRLRYFNEKIDANVANQVYDLVGGRPQHLSEVVKHSDLITECHKLIDREKTWFLNQCGLLGASMDDDVNESGKFSTSAMLLMKEFVEMYNEQTEYQSADHKLPELPLWRARQIMTRNDFIQTYDNLNIFTIDSSNSYVRADSVPMMRGFLEIASMPGFEQLLEETLERVGDIESLGRTRELVAKDLVSGARWYDVRRTGSSDGSSFRVALNKINDGSEEDQDQDHIDIQPLTKSGGRLYWDKRLR
ncbi:hypothetical protein WICPIJ_004713 [Wickerhamomyces pijperi]|uniref:AAA protein C-terminal winged helix domain-containing protein n=1 Tax=Wickerhamomyces pijperi TaxID=599730 RepID=A0A9P8TLT4_WICPI|nr:hypothetical protein WICPIJ_004713 [Wickerhamomyces pijperi]